MWTNDRATGTVVLALGNPLMGDDGLGAAVIQRLREWEWDRDVRVVDGETWGLKLLPTIEEAQRLLIVDAIDVGAAPGTVVVLDGDELVKRLDITVSPHQVGLRDVLALAELRGSYPACVTAIGAQPGRVGFGEPLSAAMADALDAVVDAALRRLALWGHATQPTHVSPRPSRVGSEGLCA